MLGNTKFLDETAAKIHSRVLHVHTQQHLYSSIYSIYIMYYTVAARVFLAYLSSSHVTHNRERGVYGSSVYKSSRSQFAFQNSLLINPVP